MQVAEEFYTRLTALELWEWLPNNGGKSHFLKHILSALLNSENPRREAVRKKQHPPNGWDRRTPC